MKKTAIVYGCLESSIQKRAVEELTEILLDYTMEYPVCLPYSELTDPEKFRCIYIGTVKSSPYIRSVSQGTLTQAESYAITVKDNTVIIEGYDDAGVLYGVLDFYNRYIVKYEHPDTESVRWANVWEEETLPSFSYTSSPSVSERGLWTWGHVIYDYRDYLHNMMKLKMNSVIIWNDYAPTNAREIVEYAHSCNIKVYFGYAWLWDTDCRRFRIADLADEGEAILRKYEKEYAAVGCDGIYFQTFTELWEDNIDGVIIADAAAKFVNETASLLFERYPDLEILFGLHANSVYDRLGAIGAVDPRVRIVWENCGEFPFSYSLKDGESFARTKDFVTRIAHLRGDGDRFGVVTKAIVALDWAQFEHLQGPQWIGVSSDRVKRNRVERKSRIWRNVQAGWLVNADKAEEMIRHMCELKSGSLSMFALVEDGMFEENIMFPVALYAEMLWHCNEDTKELIKNVAMRSYVCFA